jgi:hypothetical protein
MSISPAQNFSKPPPVPDSPTVTLASGFSPWKPSAEAWAKGKTVLEPSTATEPEVVPVPEELLLPQAVTPTASAPATTAIINLFCMGGISLFLIEL